MTLKSPMVDCIWELDEWDTPPLECSRVLKGEQFPSSKADNHTTCFPVNIVIKNTARFKEMTRSDQNSNYFFLSATNS